MCIRDSFTAVLTIGMGAKGTLEYNMAQLIGTGADALVQGLSEEQFQPMCIRDSPYYQAKSTSDIDSLDWSCSYLRNGISVVEIFPKRIVYGELDCLCS